MKLIVEIKTIYGEERVYPVCPKAQLFVELIKGKTLTPHAVEVIKKLGYVIEVKQKTLETL